MLPKNKLGRRQLRKLKVYAGPEHPHRGPADLSLMPLYPAVQVNQEDESLSDLQYYGTGRRKTATARVYLRPGSGAVSVNGRKSRQVLSRARSCG